MCVNSWRECAPYTIVHSQERWSLWNDDSSYAGFDHLRSVSKRIAKNFTKLLNGAHIFCIIRSATSHALIDSSSKWGITRLDKLSGEVMRSSEIKTTHFKMLIFYMKQDTRLRQWIVYKWNLLVFSCHMTCPSEKYIISKLDHRQEILVHFSVPLTCLFISIGFLNLNLLQGSLDSHDA